MKQATTITDDFQKTVLSKFEELNKEMNDSREQQKEYHNENMKKHDQVIGELAILRDENTIGAYQTRELREDVDDLKEKVTKIEQTHHRS